MHLRMELRSPVLILLEFTPEMEIRSTRASGRTTRAVIVQCQGDKLHHWSSVTFCAKLRNQTHVRQYFTLEAYLYQAQRGIARQRAMQETAVKYRRRESRSHNLHEKESSKDSAYGYSGGENSRLATREPTPDTWQIKQQGRRQSAGQPSITFNL